MLTLREMATRLAALRRERRAKLTLLAVCPNSASVLEAAVKVAALDNTPMLFAATLNQVDRDGGYTGWTPRAFVDELDRCRSAYRCDAPLYPCLDHGGPWLKDRHTTDRLSLDETMAETRASLTACIEAGYALLHVDPTVDRSLSPGCPVPIDLVVERTADLVEHCERARLERDLPPIAYEVGTEEVDGGLADVDTFRQFVHDLHARLAERALEDAWPTFVVGKVGTDLHTTSFDPSTARRLTEIAAELGSLVKGHYTDWVSNPEEYPESGMGGANVGPEFTAEEFSALEDLASRETDMLRGRPQPTGSGLMQALERAVADSNRWRKWLRPEEQGLEFAELSPARKAWLTRTGARYIWTESGVIAARRTLYANLSAVLPDPHGFVVDRIAAAMERYVTRFHLFDSAALLEQNSLWQGRR